MAPSQPRENGAPTQQPAYAGNPTLLEARGFHAEQRQQAFKQDMRLQDAPSASIAASSSTMAPTGSVSENMMHHMYFDPEVQPHDAGRPGRGTMDFHAKTSSFTYTRRRLGWFLAGASLVILLVIFFVLSQTVWKSSGPDEGGEGEHTGDGENSTAGAAAAVTTTTTTTTVCGTLVARMVINKRQRYDPNQPDQKMWGVANTTMCLNGTVSADALLKGGSSKILAGHIYKADGLNNTDGANGKGSAVLGFCCSDPDGACAGDDAHVDRKCAPWSQGKSENLGMEGVPFLHDNTVEELVADILQKPGQYYFSFATETSWGHWSKEGERQGAIRGQLEKRP